jgi:hypothetical protein
LSRFRGTFHSFDPVGFAIFAIPPGSMKMWSFVMTGDSDAQFAGRVFRGATPPETVRVELRASALPTLTGIIGTPSRQ